MNQSERQKSSTRYTHETGEVIKSYPQVWKIIEDLGSKNLLTSTAKGVVVNSKTNSDNYNFMLSDYAIEMMIDANQSTMERKTTFRLRDWSVSRQRFWGAPIPIVYDAEGEPHPVAEDDLPVTLPDDVDFKPTGQSPLTYSKAFHEGVEEKYGKGWKREVDTLDTFMCSSWYYFRYIDPHNNKAFASQEALKKWMPVDFYLGGPEHVNGHLLYSRFFTKVLYDAGIIDFDEPFLVHRHQGLIKGPDGRKMSKRWGNIVNPTDAVAQHGADVVRTYLMFMGPLEQEKAWSEKAILGVERFYKKVWGLAEKATADESTPEIESEINKLIKSVTEDIEEMSFNTAIAKLMEFTNFLQKQNQVPVNIWERFLLILAPFGPYITEEIWEKLGKTDSIHKAEWPTYDESQIKNDLIIMGVQVNGKIRGEIEIAPDASQEEAMKKAMAVERIASYVTGDPKKVIYVPGRILNIVLK
jgi:leucyl-tRNA synthetase